MNIADPIARFARETPDAIALESDAGTVSYRRLDLYVRSIAHRMAESGLREGMTVAIRVASPFLHVSAAIALSRLGVGQFGFSAQSVSSAEIDIAKKVGASAIVTESSEYAVAGLDAIEIQRSWLDAKGGMIPENQFSSDPGFICLVGTSSGTTGDPKIFRITQRQLAARAEHAGAIGYGKGDRFLSMLSIDVLMQKSLVLRVLMGGGTVLFANTTDPEAVADFCQKYRVTNIYAFPFMVDTIMPRNNARDRYRDLKCFSMAGATVTQELLETIVERITDNAFVVYGTSEVGTVAYADLATRRRFPNAVGRPVEGVEWKIVDEDGNPVPAGEVGLVRVRTPSMIDGYFDDDDLTSHYFKDGWFNPRDLLSATEDGILLFHGRGDDMMIVDGLNVYPAQIESVFQRHPAVLEAVAFSLESKVHQDVPAIAVSLSGPVSKPELNKFSVDNLGRRAPQRIFIVDSFPRGPTGKVIRRELAEMLRESSDPPPR